MTKENKIKMDTAKKIKTSVRVSKIEDLEGKFLLVRVGSPDQPATDSQIKDVQEQLVELLEMNNINCVAFVTHHAVEMEIIEKQK